MAYTITQDIAIFCNIFMTICFIYEISDMHELENNQRHIISTFHICSKLLLMEV